MTAPDIAAIKARLDAAHQMVADLCQGRRDWRMSIPAKPDYDPDLVIADALRGAKDAIALVEQQKAEIERLRGMLEWRPIDSRQWQDGDQALMWEDGNQYRAVRHQYSDDGYWASHCGQSVTKPPEPQFWRPLPDPPADAGKGE